MKWIVILSLCAVFEAWAQDEAKVSVVAVGEALDAKELLRFVEPTNLAALPPAAKKLTEETMQLIRNDFAFYKHRFELVAPADLTGGFRISLSATPVSGGVDMRAKVEKGGQLIGSDSMVINESHARSRGHELADAIYRLITGKRSIFKEKIYFVSDRTSQGKDVRKELYVMDFDGRGVERLTFFNSTVISPAISPDNRYVVFSLIESHVQGDRKGKELKNIDLKLYDTKTKQITTISGHPGVNSGAIFNRNGKSIYFTLTKSGNADIYEMELSTKVLRKLTTHHAEDVDPTITSDGSKMSFLSNRAGRAHIFVMDPRGTELAVRRVSFVGQFNASPRFSPLGDAIVFTSWVDNSFDLYRIDAQGNNLARLTKDFGSNEEPWWSPDGEFIIFTSQRVLSRTQATQDIYIMNKEGEILGTLTQGFGRCFTPRWTN